MSDRQTIESTLNRVQSGELSPSEATQLLLAADENAVSSHFARHESLASLVHRLGAPPTDIVASWCQQMRAIASQYEYESDESLPAIDLAEWSITPQGKLIWKNLPFDAAKATENPSARSMGHIDRFHAALLPVSEQPLSEQPVSEQPVSEQPVSEQPVGARVTSTSDVAKTTTAGLDVWRSTPAERTAEPARSGLQTEKAARRMSRRVRQALFMVAVLACVVAAGFVLYNASRSESVAATNNDTPASGATSPFTPTDAPNRTRDLPPSGAVLGGSPDSAATRQTLETFEAMSEAELSSIEAAEIEMTPSFSLDDLMPPAGFVPSASESLAVSSASGEKSTAPRSDQSSSGSMPTSVTIEQNLVDDEPAPDEAPQRTRTSTVMAIELPRVDQSNEFVSLSKNKLSGLKLDFPFDVPLTISGDETEWEIRDTREQATIARILVSAEGTKLTWSDQASDSPNAAALAHGRITERDGEMIFLRPNIEADPWPIRVDKPDVMPTWNLGVPIPPRVARFSVDLELPDEIEQGWIEPIDPGSVRRAQALAVLTPKGGETVSLGIRFDVRCGTKLSCRMRYAGRLDPSMPWQVVSLPLLEQFANQLTSQATLVSNEATRLSKVYEIAGSSGRRILRVKQNRNNALADSIRAASARVAQLQSLIAALESEGTLRIRVWVDWPDAEQNLLTMPNESNAEPE